MKSSEQVLSEWANDRITFKRKDRPRCSYLTRQQVEQLCIAINQNNPARMLGKRNDPTYINKAKTMVLGGRYARTVVYWPDAQRLAMVLTGKRMQLMPSMLIKFDDIAELVLYVDKMPEPGSS